MTGTTLQGELVSDVSCERFLWSLLSTKYGCIGDYVMDLDEEEALARRSSPVLGRASGSVQEVKAKVTAEFEEVTNILLRNEDNSFELGFGT